MSRLYVAVLVMVLGCKSKAVSEGSCDGDELDRLQTTCLLAGGSFTADTSANDLRACDVDAEGNPIGGSGSADCVLEGAGTCSITCELAADDAHDDNEEYSECWEDGYEDCDYDVGEFTAGNTTTIGQSYSRTTPTSNGEIVGTNCDVGYYCGFCNCWYRASSEWPNDNPFEYCDSEYDQLCS